MLGRSEVVRSKVRSMMLEQFVPESDAEVLVDDQSLEQTHVVDSVRMLELFVFLEETFGITVEDDDALPENFDSVNAIVAYVMRKLGE